eukprot:GEZU01022856.1.p3 GENE.GEZU01022856.1~~GEZU01022856.1.p3  ORF type:complete len:129 (+),score=21.25 GEZU01022856.1:1228-1614(+)
MSIEQPVPRLASPPQVCQLLDQIRALHVMESLERAEANQRLTNADKDAPSVPLAGFLVWISSAIVAIAVFSVKHLPRFDQAEAPRCTDTIMVKQLSGEDLPDAALERELPIKRPRIWCLATSLGANVE